MGTSRSAYVALGVGNAAAFLPPPEPESSTPRQIAMPECATEPYNPHLLGQAVEEGGNDGGMEGWIGRKRGRMMEWLLNIQHAAESMRRVVGSLHYGAASQLHVFVFSSKFLEKQHLFSPFALFCLILLVFLNILDFIHFVAVYSWLFLLRAFSGIQSQ